MGTNNYDSFDDLIKNFKLDQVPDPDAQEPAQTPGPDRPDASQAPEPPQPVGKQPAAPRPAPAKKKFELHIEDEEFERIPDVDPNRKPEPPRMEPASQKRRSRFATVNRWLRAVLMLICVVAGCIFLATFVLESANDLFGLNQLDRQIEVTIPEGASSSEIIDLLGDSGVIDQKLTFRVYAGLKKAADQFQAGDYLLNSNMSYDEIIIALKSGNTAQQEVTITFYEGMTMMEMLELLEEKEVCSQEELLDYLETAELDYEFINMLPEDELRFRRLEGYLFPDTYDFYLGENVASVARKFLNNFNSKITDEMYDRMQDLNLSLDETLTLASIIQQEAGNAEEMKRVSSVFHNRLDLPEVYPRLQSDVTIHYVEQDIRPYLDINDQPMYDAYNTYVAEGLPVGPICNPGMDAIEAALYPEETEYYFFVTDSAGKYYYATTLEEHDQNVYIASQVTEGDGDTHGTGVQ